MSVAAFLLWNKSGFSEMNPESLMRLVLPAATMAEVGIETIFASFFVGILRIDTKGTIYG